MTGAYPKCEIVPEPATICLLGLGSLVLLRKRR
ncbi:MAG: PEP-CTERM sorting domain-containing protein [Planctomycetota bacterium]